MRIKMIAGLALAGALVVTTASAQQDSARPKPAIQQANGDVALKPKPGRILGIRTIVYLPDSGAKDIPVEGAEVVDLITGDSYFTRSTGLIGLGAFASQNDSVAVYIRKIGFRDTSFIAKVGPRDTVPITLVLERVTQLDATKVLAARTNPLLAEFESNRADKTLHGVFIQSEELRARAKTPIYSILIAHGYSENKNISLTQPCVLKVWVDKMPVEDFDLHTSYVDDYEAIEFYPHAASAPVGLVGSDSGKACEGILRLWTRRS